MAKLALYREYRPNKFSDVIGQEVIVKILQKSINLNKINHAYLFSGPRGTGKTSVARLLAKAINCQNLTSGDVCDECDSCKQIKQGRFADVVEIDAASNNGVDQIRSLIDKAGFAPVSSTKKIYIIDEVHMLTQSAFNALLKLLEEPPAHVIFILATTEVYKVIPTIISRCQRFDFKNLSDSNVAKRLQEICETEDVAYEQSALALIAACSEGGMRNALTYLEQAIIYTDSVLDLDCAVAVTGSASQADIYSLALKIKDSQAAQALDLIETIVLKGIDVTRIVFALINLYKEVIYFHNTNRLSSPYVDFKTVKELDEQLTIQDLNSYLFILSKLLKETDKNSNAKLLLEVTILELCQKDNPIVVATATKEVGVANSTLDLEVIKTLEQKLDDKLSSKVDSLEQNLTDSISREVEGLERKIAQYRTSFENLKQPTAELNVGVSKPQIETIVNDLLGFKYPSRAEVEELIDKTINTNVKVGTKDISSDLENRVQELENIVYREYSKANSKAKKPKIAEQNESAIWSLFDKTEEEAKPIVEKKQIKQEIDFGRLAKEKDSDASSLDTQAKLESKTTTVETEKTPVQIKTDSVFPGTVIVEKKTQIDYEDSNVSYELVKLYEHAHLEAILNQSISSSNRPENEARKKRKAILREVVEDLKNSSSNHRVRMFSELPGRNYNISDDNIVLSAATDIEKCQELMTKKIRFEVLSVLRQKTGIEIKDYVVLPKNIFDAWGNEIKQKLSQGHEYINLNKMPDDILKTLVTKPKEIKTEMNENIENIFGVPVKKSID